MGGPPGGRPRFWSLWPDPNFWRVMLSTLMINVINGWNVVKAMSKEALKKILKEVNALTPQERRELIDRLAHEAENSQEQVGRNPGTLKGTVRYMAPDFDAPSSLTTHEEEMSGNGATLRKWLNEARNLRAELPLTSDSVDILRELRQVRSSQ